MRPRQLASLAFFGLLAATGVNFLGGGSGTEGKILGRCVVLQGSGWAPTTCVDDTGTSIPGAVPAENLGAAGEFGAQGVAGALTDDQIRHLWVAHGGDPAKASVAIAVARAESGGRPDATNSSNSDGTVDRGLFQINSIHGSASTYDLDANVAYAAQLSRRGHDWSPWVAYTSGAYRRFL